MSDDNPRDQQDDDHDFSDFDDLFDPEELEESAFITDDTPPDAPTSSTSPDPHPASEFDDLDSLEDLLDEEDTPSDATSSMPSEPANTESGDQPIEDEIADALDPMEAATQDDIPEINSNVSDDDLIDTPLADALDATTEPANEIENDAQEASNDTLIEDEAPNALDIENAQEEDPEPFDDALSAQPATEMDEPVVEQEDPELSDEAERDNDPLPDLDFAEDGDGTDADDKDDAEKEHQSEEIDSLDDEFEDFLVDIEEAEDAPTAGDDFSSQVALDPVPETPIDSIEDDQPIADDGILEDTPNNESINPAQDLDDTDTLFDHEEETDSELEEEEDMKQNMIALIAGAVALLASMGAVWLGYSAKADLANRPVVEADSSSILDAAQIKGMQQQIGGMDERLKKLATQIATQGSLPPSVSEAQVEAIATRTNRLEQLVSDIKEQIGHLRSRRATTSTSTPAASKATPRKKSAAHHTHKPRTPANQASNSWFVNLTSHSNQKSAGKQISRLKALGISAESKRVLVRGKIYYRVRIAGFSTKSKAESFKAMLLRKHHIRDSWTSNH
ncbi:MAG: SPOR domain-containing protein [Mariprofundales bacterium]